MNSSAYYASIAEAYAEVCKKDYGTNKVPNATKQLSRVFDEQYGVSGRRETDEPTEPQKTQYLRVDKKKFDADMKVWKQRNQSTLGKERLKRKGAVPTKSGKRLFEDFMKDAHKASGKKTKEEVKMEKNARQIYNSARALEFDKWCLFVTEML